MEHIHHPAAVNRTTVRVINVGNIIAPLLFTLYNIFVIMSLTDAGESFYIPNLLGFIGSMLWLVHALHDFVKGPHSTLPPTTKYILYHMLMVGILLGVTGFSSPLAYIWVFYTVVSYIYFGRRGMFINLALLPILALIDIALHNFTIDYVIFDTMTAIVTMSIGALSAAAMLGARIDQREFDHTKAQALLQRERIATIINNLTDAVISTNEHGKVTVFNAAALSLLDTNTPIDTNHIDSILPLYNENNESISLHKELLANTKTKVRDDLHTFINDEEVQLEIKYSPIHGSYGRDKRPQHPGYIIIMRDITTEKSLDDERDEFISVVSHELRTPITIAEGTVSNALLMTNQSKLPRRKIVASIEEAHDQLLFLARMINDLGALSRAQRGAGDMPESIDINVLVYKLYEKYYPQATEKGLIMNVHVPHNRAKIFTSRLYLEELLQNIITNAIKYTPKGTIDIVATVKKDVLTLSVKDTGIGISKSERVKVFQRFYRSEDYRTRETSGTGLGLYIAGKLAAKIGTSITLQSRLNHGSTFSINLPVANQKS